MRDSKPLTLRLFASATYPVQLASAVSYRQKDRLDVHAEVDPETGEVRLFVDPDVLSRYLNNR